MKSLAGAVKCQLRVSRCVEEYSLRDKEARNPKRLFSHLGYECWGIAADAEAQALSSPNGRFCFPTSVRVGPPNHVQAGLLKLDTIAWEWFNLGGFPGLLSLYGPTVPPHRNQRGYSSPALCRAGVYSVEMSDP
jgi:hypothetical protein